MSRQRLRSHRRPRGHEPCRETAEPNDLHEWILRGILQLNLKMKERREDADRLTSKRRGIIRVKSNLESLALQAAPGYRLMSRTCR